MMDVYRKKIQVNDTHVYNYAYTQSEKLGIKLRTPTKTSSSQGLFFYKAREILCFGSTFIYHCNCLRAVLLRHRVGVRLPSSAARAVSFTEVAGSARHLPLAWFLACCLTRMSFLFSKVKRAIFRITRFLFSNSFVVECANVFLKLYQLWSYFAVFLQ